MPNEIQEALTAWRDADRRLHQAIDGDRAALESEVERHRSTFQRLSADLMLERIDALKDAELRRHRETPSTEPYHKAAREEKQIAAEIWNDARINDEDTPSHVS